jgi:hypothetical protein
MNLNFYKHQIVIILMVTNVTKEDVIKYCGALYKSNYGGLLAIFKDPKHMHDGSNSKDDGFANDHDEGVIDISGIKPMDESIPPTNDGGACVELISSVTLLDRTFIRLCHTMQDITKECSLGGVALLYRANSLLIVVALDILNIRLTKANESLHLGLRLHHVDDGVRNYAHRLKDWHETMFSHNFARKKKTHE